jgi:hypothetical protein
MPPAIPAWPQQGPWVPSPFIDLNIDEEEDVDAGN